MKKILVSMPFTIISCVIFCLLAAGCAQQEEPKAFPWNPNLKVYRYQDVIKDDLWKVRSTGTPLTGRVQHKRMELEFKDGKRHGRYKKYYENGQLHEEGQFKEGKKHGLSKSYWENGRFETEVHWVDGKSHGPWKYHEKDGHLKITGFFKEGKRNGPERWYFKSGQISWEGHYKNDKLHGPTKGYFENGKLEAEYHHIDGKIHGELKFYNKDSTLNRVEEWENGTRIKIKWEVPKAN